jgi:hypothetical protein
VYLCVPYDSHNKQRLFPLNSVNKLFYCCFIVQDEFRKSVCPFFSFAVAEYFYMLVLSHLFYANLSSAWLCGTRFWRSSHDDTTIRADMWLNKTALVVSKTPSHTCVSIRWRKLNYKIPKEISMAVYRK